MSNITGKVLPNSGDMNAPKKLSLPVVLIVDDERVVRSVAERLLKAQGYSVLTAGNAEEAFELLKRNDRIRVVLTDVRLPGTATGVEMARAICAMRPHIKVICMSGYPIELLKEQGVPIHGMSFLRKPFGSAELVSYLKDALASA